MVSKLNQPVTKLELQDLMLYQVHEILLVASPYDAFVLEEDGRLTEQILQEYRAMQFYQAPRLWRAESGKSALKLLEVRDFDVIIVMLRLSDINTIELCSQIKSKYPNKPILLLIFDEYEIDEIPDGILNQHIDKVFLWAGNTSVFPAMMKYIEDKKNADRDIQFGGVRTIIFVEDNPRYYSAILPLLYKQIMFHTKILVDESLNATQRLLHLRGRTKVLVTSTYEEACNYFNKYKDNTLGVISDIRFTKNGKLDGSAGIQFAKYIRKIEPYMPVIMQSTNLENAQKARKVNADFLYKLSNTLLKDLQKFMLNNFGFGEFVFRTLNESAIDTASNVQTLYSKLKTLPIESIIFHANGNHFSNWLANRGEFAVATILRPISVKSFKDPEDLRIYLLDAIKTILINSSSHQITDFTVNRLKQNVPFLRIGQGSLGGKARGLLFMNSIITKSEINDTFNGVNIRIPRSVVIGANEFTDFIKNNDLLEEALTLNNNDDIINLFLSKPLPKTLIKTLDTFLKYVKYPLAVRSSSLLEDSQFQPLAGFYSTFMLPNSDKKRELRLKQIVEAIIRVYASIFFTDPKTLMADSKHRIEEEKLAILIMELVGQKFDNRFYPTLSGVARSINYYPISYMERNEGVASIALGFGKGVMEGEKALRFSPKYPRILPQYYSVNATIDTSQNSFYSLNIQPNPDLLSNGEKCNLEISSLNIAEEDGQLFWAGSVVSADDNRIRDSLQYSGPRVVTFAPILKWNQFPLCDILIEILKIGKKALGNPVEIEFSVNLNRTKNLSEFCLLQIRPMLINDRHSHYEKINYKEDDIICKSSKALGNGVNNQIKDIIYVNHDTFNIAKTEIIATEIESFNNKLKSNKPYLLVGHGRWGTADPWLGIPVDWNQISGASAIVEVGSEILPVDPSFGTHFFQNIAGMRIPYFTIDNKHRGKDSINLKLLGEFPVREQKVYTSWIELDHPLLISINGNTGEGLIANISNQENEIMDEAESTGI